MGVELSQPLITPETLEYNFTNEGGVNHTIRFLKNIMGLWLVQECRREWQRQGMEYSYDELISMASAAPAFQSFVNPEDPRFLHPGDMVPRLQGFCRETGQPVPDTRGAIIRCALESLALEYRWVTERLEKLLGRPLPVIHVIGGGSQNRLLNQFTADSTARQVIAGPVEATAIGNLMVQALGLGLVSTLAEAREIVRQSYEVRHFTPVETAPWDAAYDKYVQLKLPSPAGREIG
jgi:rhamnulokinase